MSHTNENDITLPQSAPSSSTQLESAPLAAPTPGAESVDYTTLVQAFKTIRVYFDGIVNDALKPSIARLLKACQANAQVEALLVTPLLLGSLIFIATFVSLTSLLIIFKSLGLFFRLIFLASGTLAAVFGWLLAIFTVSVVISGTATALFVAMNVAIAFVSDKIQQAGVQGGFMPPRIRSDLDWTQAKNGMLAVADVCKQNMKMSTAVFLEVWKAILQLSVHLFSSIHMTNAALRDRTSVVQEEEPRHDKGENEPEIVLVPENKDKGNLEVYQSVEGLRQRVQGEAQ